ncbi:MAG TPA: hypothetical protein VGU23_07720, partial [Acidobacteriaceae bacterium]|nr:hypothetical protein [Acidobacteriaceae bacterium]
MDPAQSRRGRSIPPLDAANSRRTGILALLTLGFALGVAGRAQQPEAAAAAPATANTPNPDAQAVGDADALAASSSGTPA